MNANETEAAKKFREKAQGLAALLGKQMPKDWVIRDLLNDAAKAQQAMAKGDTTNMIYGLGYCLKEKGEALVSIGQIIDDYVEAHAAYREELTKELRKG